MQRFRIFTIIAFFISSVSLVAQQESDPEIEMSDPKAVSLLDKISKKLETADNYSAQFTFSISHPEEETINKRGSLLQEGPKYFVDLEDQTYTCDGEAVWVHMIPQKEVQINDMEETEDGFDNPSDFLSIYQKEDFIFGILTSYYKGKSVVKEIEFKPTNLDSEYSKVRIVVDETKKEILEVITFFKNGSQYKLSVKKWQLNIPTTDAMFVFDASKFPGVYIEDLRF